jgi:hypothetical protein
VPAYVFVPFLTLPILGAFFLDTDLFVLFLIVFCVVGGLCTSSADPLDRSHREDATPSSTRDVERKSIAR